MLWKKTSHSLDEVFAWLHGARVSTIIGAFVWFKIFLSLLKWTHLWDSAAF